MYLKTLEVLSGAKVIRTITFHNGLNLIIGVSDNAQSDSGGNAVGKTTVLKLIDFCFGGGVENIYTDHEKEERNVNTSLKDFLIKEKISVRLSLCRNLHSSENDIYIERSCFKTGKSSYTVNGLPVSSKMKLPDGRSILELIFNCKMPDRPTVREIVSHNIRYDDHRISNAVDTLHKYATDDEREVLMLYLLGISTDFLTDLKNVKSELKKLKGYHNYILSGTKKITLIDSLSENKNKIDQITKTRNETEVLDDVKELLSKRDRLSFRLNNLTQKQSSLSFRRNSLKAAALEFKNSQIEKSEVLALQQIYNQVTKLGSPLMRSFEQVISYHNEISKDRSLYLQEELPKLNDLILQLAEDISKDTAELILTESRIKEVMFSGNCQQHLADLYEEKGRLTETIELLDKIEEKIKRCQHKIKGTSKK